MHRGELAPLQIAKPDRFTDAMVSGLLEDWKESQTISIACDLVSAALTLGRFAAATDAAKFILSANIAPPAASNLANIYLRQRNLAVDSSAPTIAESQQSEASSIASLPQYLRSGIRETRNQLVSYPRNPILWMNLARLYTSLGIHEKAERAMRTALAMAPENRFVLRASSRFLLHLGRKDHAHWLLAKAASINTDPWILAAEIATASAIGRTSKFIKNGRRLIEAERFPPFHLSELGSALGTLDSLAGNLKSAKNLIDRSLRHPTENAIAQAAWVSRAIGGILVTRTIRTESAEANAWQARNAGKWNSALREAEYWQADQPFSSRPAMFGSHLASTIVEDYNVAIAFAKQGLLSNPDDFALHNNLAFALAMRGDWREARKALQNVKEQQLREAERLVYYATSGLIAFRSGDPESGRALYRLAIDHGKRSGDQRGRIANIYYAIESLRIRSKDAEAIRRLALEECAGLTDPTELELIERLKHFGR
jgi:tetratricopeptide (TPR) repeat protein